jgi:hypothetical protein
MRLPRGAARVRFLGDTESSLKQKGHTHVNKSVKKFMLHTAVAVLASLLLIAWFPFEEEPEARGNTKHFLTPAVFQAAGPNVASIQGVVDQFRLALGGVNNVNVPGPLGNGRREINWDGGGSAATAAVPTPFTGFLNSRGALFTTDGDGFVQAPLDGLVTTFGNLTYNNIFQPFSQLRLFSPVGSNVTEVDFFIPGGGNIVANTTGFGAIFSDVDQPDGSGPSGKRGNRGSSTLVEYFGTSGDLLFSAFAPASPGDASLSFFGVVFEDPRIAQVRITTGDAVPSVDDEANRDVVMMDDFIFGEPRIGQ